ncbi:MAG: chemotaxis protein CheB [Archangium sp.]|nr:chemotaxis protein CheB [Archangium sp.]
MNAPLVPPRVARVLVVDDAASYRHVLSKILASIPGVEVVGLAGSVAAARRRIEQGGVDVVTLDVNLSEESGLELLEWTRRRHPRLITILVTAGQAAGARTEVDALLTGAAALILKPFGPGAVDALRNQLAHVLNAAVKVERAPSVTAALSAGEVRAATRELIAVGASTGGPPVLQEFLGGLPASFDVPVVIVQHMPVAHVPFFAELLAAKSGRPGRVAADGEPVLRGHFYLAGHGKHLVVRRTHGRLTLHHDTGPEEHFCRPAVDPFFRSVAAVCGPATLGVVMTGMGHDGGAGAQALRAAGAPVVVQDEATSVVWSMPRSVVDRGAACLVAPRSELSKVVMGWTRTDHKDGTP